MRFASKKTLIWAVCLLAVVIFVVVILLITGGKSETPEVILPSPISAATPTPDSGESSDTSEEGVTVSNVQAVISAMERKETYMRSMSIIDYWSGGSAERLVSVWVDGDKMRILITEASRDQMNVLVTGEGMWIWYDADGNIYKTEKKTDLRTMDELQGIITYEDILELDVKNISDAGYEEYLGEPCVYVEYSEETSDYVTKAYISAASGLLTGAEIYSGDSLIYSMESVAYAEEISSRDVFELPGED